MAEKNEVGEMAMVPVQGEREALFRTDDPQEIIKRAQEIATPLAKTIEEKKLSNTIQGKEYVRVEGWTLLGAMVGLFPATMWSRPIKDNNGKDGFESRVEVRTLTGRLVGAAESCCTRSEKIWATRDDYALKSMSQTRATSKALRMPLGWIMVLGGFEATPAEEIPQDGTPLQQPHAKTPKPPPQTPPQAPASPQNSSLVIGEIEAVVGTSGVKNGKAWKRWGISLKGSDTYGTFDETHASIASTIKSQGEKARIMWKREGKYLNIVTIEPDLPENPDADRPPPDMPDDEGPH